MKFSLIFFVSLFFLLLTSFSSLAYAKIIDDPSRFVNVTTLPYLPYSMIVPTSAQNFLLLVSGYSSLAGNDKPYLPLILTSVSLQSNPPKVVDTFKTNITCDQFNTQLNDLYLNGWIFLGACRLAQNSSKTSIIGFESALIQVHPVTGRISILDQLGFSDSNYIGYRSIGTDNFFNGRDTPTIIYAKEQPSHANYNDTVTPIIISIVKNNTNQQPQIKIHTPNYEMCCLNGAYIYNGLSFYSNGFINLWSYAYAVGSSYQFSTVNGDLLFTNSSVAPGGVYSVTRRNSFEGFSVVTLTNDTNYEHDGGIQGFNFKTNKANGELLVIPKMNNDPYEIVGGPVMAGDENVFFVMDDGSSGEQQHGFVTQVKVGKSGGEIKSWNRVRFDSWGTRGNYAMVAASEEFVVVLNVNGYKNFAAAITAYRFN